MSRDRERLKRYDASTWSYMIIQFTDEDHDSQVTLEAGETYFQARLRHDRVHRHVDGAGAVRYSFEHIPDDEGGEVHVYSKFGEVDTDTFCGGEFSELLQWDRHMLVFDDRTGIVGELRGPNHMIIPRQMLMTASGDEAQKGFKCEWATLRGDELIVSSHGKMRHEEWIKRLGPEGYTVTSEDWGDAYRRMREACGVGEAGYVVRGGGVAPRRERWYFFPSKVSTEPFHEPTETLSKAERRASTPEPDRRQDSDRSLIMDRRHVLVGLRSLDGALKGEKIHQRPNRRKEPAA